MSSLDSPIEIPVEDGRCIPGTLVGPATALPGFLFVQGWGSDQEQYLARAREIAALGCVCLTFEPRGAALAPAPSGRAAEVPSGAGKQSRNGSLALGRRGHGQG